MATASTLDMTDTLDTTGIGTPDTDLYSMYIEYWICTMYLRRMYVAFTVDVENTLSTQ